MDKFIELITKFYIPLTIFAGILIFSLIGYIVSKNRTSDLSVKSKKSKVKTKETSTPPPLPPIDKASIESLDQNVENNTNQVASQVVVNQNAQQPANINK